MSVYCVTYQCTKWDDNKNVFGCTDKKIKQELKFLCNNVKINAGANVPPIIMFFRGGKYWKFDDKPKPNKPFGNLIEGQVPANLDYPGIHFPGGAGHQKPDKFIMVYKDKWSRWKPTDPMAGAGGDSPIQPAGGDEPEQEDSAAPDKDKPPKGGKKGGKGVPDGDGGGQKGDPDKDDDGDKGALILVDPQKPLYGKIKGAKVCYLTIRGGKAYWKGKCKPVNKDPNNFPPHIVAAVKNKDKDWYFVEANSTYCKRKDDECIY
jgi:hypothetical protein